MAVASFFEIMPFRASMAAWAREPAMSWAYSRLSKPMEALIFSMIADGPAAKRPPHSALARGLVPPFFRLALMRGRP